MRTTSASCCTARARGFGETSPKVDRRVAPAIMETYKQQFIEFMVEAGVLTFGDFTTKSGRKTPYFINTGRYSTGAQLARLGDFYASAIEQGVGRNFDVLFGPAYKGIPLVVTASMALER